MKKIVRQVCGLASSRIGKWGSVIMGLTASAKIITKLPKEQRGQVLGYLAGAGVAIGGAVMVGKIIFDKKRAKNQIKIVKAKAMSEAEAEWVKLAGKQMFGVCNNSDCGSTTGVETGRMEDNAYQAPNISGETTVQTQPWKSGAEIIKGEKKDSYGVRFAGNLLGPGDILFMYSDDGLGKSTLAAQWGIEASWGVKSQAFPNDDNVAIPPKVTTYIYDVENDDDLLSDRLHGLAEKDMGNINFKGLDFENIDDLIADMQDTARNLTTPCIFILDNTSCLTLDTLKREDFIKLRKAFQAIHNDMMSRDLYASMILVGHALKTSNSKKGFMGISEIGTLTQARVELEPTRFGDDVVMLVVKKLRKGAKPSQGILLKRVKEPYLHFEYLGMCEFEDARPLDGRLRVAKDVDYSDDDPSDTETRYPNQSDDDEWPDVAPGVCEEDSEKTQEEYAAWFLETYSIPPESVNDDDMDALMKLDPENRNERNEKIIVNYLLGGNDSGLARELNLSVGYIHKLRRGLGFKKTYLCQKREI